MPVKKYSEEEYREAARLWRRENPDIEMIPGKAVVTISNGKEVPIGRRMAQMRHHLNRVKDPEFWKEFGLFAENQAMKDKYTEEEYQEAARLWRKENPEAELIPGRTVITIASGKVVPIGRRMQTLRKHSETVKNPTFWAEYGLLVESKAAKDRYTEEEYQEAARLWRQENPEAEMISARAVITISSGKKVPIGFRLHNMRQHLERVENKSFWKEYGLFAENQAMKDKYTEEEYQEAARLWRRENPEIELIPTKAVVTISNGKKVAIGVRMQNMRKAKEKVKNPEFWKEYGLFKEARLTKGKFTEEEYQEAARLWRKENPEAEIIPKKAVVTISNGKEVTIGTRMNNMRTHPEKVKNPEFWKEYGLFVKKSQGEKEASHVSTREKYTKLFHGDKEKAERVVAILKNIREMRKAKKKEDWTIDNLLEEFDINIEKLMNDLTKTRTEGKAASNKVLTYHGKTLRQFCIENAYNYEVVSRAIKLHQFCENDTLEQLIHRALLTYQKQGQRQPATWIYEKYGTLIKHILLYLKLDADRILYNMNKYMITLEEAIRHEVFKRNREKQENEWLEELYEYLIEEIATGKKEEQTTTDIADMFWILAEEYHLTKEEMTILWNAFADYVKTIKNYCIVEVGLETDPEAKVEKIKDYNLEIEDIEESFFIPLEFDQKVLIGRKSELYQRRQLLRQYIIDWDYYTEEEKEYIKLQNHFNEEEMKKIEDTRKEINAVIKKTR